MAAGVTMPTTALNTRNAGDKQVIPSEVVARRKAGHDGCRFPVQGQFRASLGEGGACLPATSSRPAVHPISFFRSCTVSASSAGLSQRMRAMDTGKSVSLDAFKEKHRQLEAEGR